MEAIVTTIQVWDKNCIGCVEFKRDILISFKVEGGSEFNDIFLTKEQAEALVQKLEKRLAENEQ